MPFVKADVKREIEEKRKNDPEFRKTWDESREEYEKIGREISKRKTETTGFFDETMQSLQEAVAIKSGEIPVEKVDGMPAPTYRAKSKEK